MCRFVDQFFQTLVKIVDFTFCIVDSSKITCILLTNFVGVDFWQNIYVECSPEAEKKLHFVRPPPPPHLPLTRWKPLFWKLEE